MFKKMMLAVGLAAAICLSGCTSAGGLTAGVDPAKAEAKVQAVQQQYDALRPLAALMLPYLPATTAAKVRAAAAIVERALLAARIATTIAAQEAELKRAREQIELLASVAPASI